MILTTFRNVNKSNNTVPFTTTLPNQDLAQTKVDATPKSTNNPSTLKPTAATTSSANSSNGPLKQLERPSLLNTLTKANVSTNTH